MHTHCFIQTLWPFFDDTIILLPDGYMVSALFGVADGNVSLLNHSCAHDFGLPTVSKVYNYSNCTVAAALANPQLALSAVIDTWSRRRLPDASDVSTPTFPTLAQIPAFSLTLSGPTVLVLRSKVC